MRITRLRATDFRGWHELDLRPSGHVLVVGEPRSGRTDIVLALTRVLDPRSTRAQPSTADIHQQVTYAGTQTSTEATGPGGSKAIPLAPEEGLAAESPGSLAAVGLVTHAEFGEVEVTLTDLDSDLEQEADGALEPLLADGTVDESDNADASALLGLRIAYRVTYEAATDTLEHRVFFPALSDPASDKYVRVPTTVRLMIPVVFMDAARPLQLRAEGLLRRLIAEHDPEAATTALRALETQIVAAASALSGTAAISTVLNAVLSDTGPARRIGDRPVTATDVQFLPEDGSLAGLLRAVQPVMGLDQAGPLPLSNHGYHVFRARLHEPRLNPFFLSWTGNTIGGRWAERNGKQSVNLASISLRMIKQMPVIVPAAGEAEKIASSLREQLDSYDRLESALKSARYRAAALRRSLLGTAFSGRLTGVASDVTGTQVVEELSGV